MHTIVVVVNTDSVSRTPLSVPGFGGNSVVDFGSTGALADIVVELLITASPVDRTVRDVGLNTPLGAVGSIATGSVVFDASVVVVGATALVQTPHLLFSTESSNPLLQL